MIWTELKTTAAHIAPWLALIALTVFTLTRQEQSLTARLDAIHGLLEVQAVTIQQMERQLAVGGFVVPPVPFRPEESANEP